jgi:hypothetical protein
VSAVTVPAASRYEPRLDGERSHDISALDALFHVAIVFAIVKSDGAVGRAGVGKDQESVILDDFRHRSKTTRGVGGDDNGDDTFSFQAARGIQHGRSMSPLGLRRPLYVSPVVFVVAVRRNGQSTAVEMAMKKERGLLPWQRRPRCSLRHRREEERGRSKSSSAVKYRQGLCLVAGRVTAARCAMTGTLAKKNPGRMDYSLPKSSTAAVGALSRRSRSNGAPNISFSVPQNRILVDGPPQD